MAGFVIVHSLMLLGERWEEGSLGSPRAILPVLTAIVSVGVLVGLAWIHYMAMALSDSIREVFGS
jgi:hypothetical protein